MAIAIERLDDCSGWEKELSSFQGSIFMSSNWISVISNNERKPVYLRFIENEKPVALLGGIELLIKTGPARQLFFYSGIISDGEDATLIARCKAALYEYAQKTGYHRVTLRSYDCHSYLKTQVWQFKARERMEYVFYLDRDIKEVINCFDRDLKRRVRKSKKEGAVFRKSCSPELTETLFKLLEETYSSRQAKGYGSYNYLFLPFFGRNEIEQLIKKGDAAFYYVEKEEKILSIQLVIFHERKAYSALMGTSPNGYRDAAPSLLFYELALTLKEQGYSYLNIGGVPRSKQQKGLKKFKDSLGAEIVMSAEEQTNFISPPLSILNPFLDLKRYLSGLKFMPGRIKLPCILFIDLVIQKRDRY